jgi:transposase
MPKTYRISAEQIEGVSKLRKKINDKQVDKRLRAVQLRGEGKDNHEIAEILETCSDVVSRWVSSYVKGGIEALMPKKHTGRPRNISHEEEAELLAGFEKSAEAGQIVEVSDIKRAYEEKVGHRIGSGQIYYVLKRHNWRKVKPRSRHPKKASREVIETSKKLTIEFAN